MDLQPNTKKDYVFRVKIPIILIHLHLIFAISALQMPNVVSITFLLTKDIGKKAINLINLIYY